MLVGAHLNIAAVLRHPAIDRVRNGRFVAGLADWTTGTSLTPSVVAGMCHIARSGSVTTSAAFRQQVPVRPGATYLLQFLSAGSRAARRVDCGSQVVLAAAVELGLRSARFIAESGIATINFWPENDGETTQIGDVSVIEIG